MDQIGNSTAYQLEHSVNIVYRETEKTIPISQSYSRSGLILLTQSIENNRWQREIHEYIMSEDLLNNILYKKEVERAFLEEQHGKLREQQKFDIGLSGPIIIESNLENSDLCGVSIIGSVLRYDLLYLPTVLQGLPYLLTKFDFNDSWTTPLRLSAGAGYFTVSYTTKCIEKKDYTIKLLVNMKNTTEDCDLGNITLLMTPEGSFSIDLLKQNEFILPEIMSGSYQFRVRANLENYDGKKVDIEVLNFHSEYQIKRILIVFDNQKIYPVKLK